MKSFLAMGNIVEDIPIESARKIDYPFMDWVGKYIIEMEDQGCTKIACIGRELFDMHALKGIHNEILI